MRNPIHNACVSITKRDLVRCKRCNCPDLAWVKFKSGKSGLVQTAGVRPFWRGHGPAPEGLFALKFNFHKCEEYLALKADVERRASECHPKASNPAEILADAMRVPILQAKDAGDFMLLSNEDNPIGAAMKILMTAQSNVPNLIGAKI